MTVLVPFVPPDELGPEVERGLAELCAGAEPFEFVLAKMARFPEVLYLAPDPASAFLALTDLVMARFPGYPPYGGRYAEVIPHLTIADCEARPCQNREALFAEIERAIVPGIPIKASAREVWLMTGDDQWHLRTRFPLGGAT